MHDRWDTFFSSITCLPADGVSHAPGQKDFQRFEAKYGMVLPQSYRSFVSRSGPGVLGDLFRIAAPGYGGMGHWFDLDRLNRESIRTAPPEYIAEVHCRGLDSDESADIVKQLQRMVFFCTLEAEEFIGWDTLDESDAGPNEYGICIVPRMGPPVYCCCSFYSFIYDICMGSGFKEFFHDDESSEAAFKRSHTFRLI